jgi:hypothetical protein
MLTAESLVDLDPEPIAREPRWPFYVAWAVGGVVLGGILLSHLPGPVPHTSIEQSTTGIMDEPPVQSRP